MPIQEVRGTKICLHLRNGFQLAPDRKEPKFVVALIGPNGNLGQALKRNLEKYDFLVLPILRVGSNDSKFFCLPHETICTSGIKPNLIVNTSNFYSPKMSAENENEMFDSIVGVAKAISIKNLEWRIPIVTFSSYFQFAPIENKPWSLYSFMKDQAYELLNASSAGLGVDHWDFTLHDTYGGVDRGKFFDKLLRAINFSEATDATLGEQEINLTHVDDVGSNLALVFKKYFENSQDNLAGRYQIKHATTYTLRSLTKLAEDLLGRELPINWGALPYRDREVFDLWEIDLPFIKDFSHSHNLEEYFSNLNIQKELKS